jgi:hypothetical protein
MGSKNKALFPFFITLPSIIFLAKYDLNENSILSKAYIGTLGDYTDKVVSLQTTVKNLNTELLGDAKAIAGTLANSVAVANTYAAVKTYETSKAVADAATKPGTTTTSLDVVDAPAKKDVFIPASSGQTIVSGDFGAFTLDGRDDILAAPNIRNATAGGGSDMSALVAALSEIRPTTGGNDVSALISALSGMSFHVTNVFDGDKIQSNLSIRQGQTLNNINQV